ncbi:YciC family protein [Spongorhabdus nitratireducens]
MTLSYLSDTWHFYKTHFLKICYIFLPYILLTELTYALQGTITDEERFMTLSGLLVFLFNAVLFPLCQGALIVYLSSVMAGDTLSPLNAYRISRRFLVSMVAIYLIVYTLSGLAFALLIIPGLIVWIKFSFADFYCVLENAKARTAVAKSWRETKSSFWLLAKGQFLIMLVTVMPSLVLVKFYNPDTVAGAVMSFLLSIFVWLVYPLSTIYAFRIFCAQRADV